MLSHLLLPTRYVISINRLVLKVVFVFIRKSKNDQMFELILVPPVLDSEQAGLKGFFNSRKFNVSLILYDKRLHKL